MRTFQSWLGLLAACTFSASAQVAVEVLLDQEQFLPGETLVVGVKISNRSGETLHFGKTSEWLKLTVEGDGGFSVQKSEELPDGKPFTLDSSKAATKRLNLEPHLRLSKPGRYKLRAEVRIPGWDDSIVSPVKNFDVITGAKLWDQVFGVPGSGSPPEIRKYALQQANYLKHIELFARVTDESEENFFRVVPLGPLVSFGRPTASLDKRCNLHVIFQTSARGFRHCVLNPDGALKLRQSYVMENSRPNLTVDEEGDIFVKGGSRMKTADDFPPEPEALSAAATNAPATNAPAPPP